VSVLLLAITLFAGPFGIDVGYYLHLGSGQWHLIWNQVPIKEIVQDADTDPFVRDRLILAGQIRSYAIDALGLEGSDNYTTYCDVGGGPVIWALTASPQTKIEPHRWSYPVIGSAPYRGFFDRARAEQEESKFRARGYDTYLRGVSAFSTLGWFRDPLLTSMLRYDTIDLADLLIHELLHATIWIEGDADFNESLATFVGRAGARAWAMDELAHGADSLAARSRAQSDRQVYSNLMRELSTRLDSLYSQKLPKETVLLRKSEEITRLRERAALVSWQTKGYGDPDKWRVNNATLALHRTYNRETDVFDRVLEVTGNLRAAIKVFESCEDQRDPEAYLERWLEKRNTSSK
jgi:predicted aminopeptidase